MIGNRIKQLRKHLKMTQAIFGASIGVSGPAVTHWEKDDNQPDGSTKNAICSRFNVNRDWLLTGKGAMFKDEATEIRDLINQRKIIETTQIPVITRCPAGFPDQLNDTIIEYIFLPDMPKNAYAIIATGNSMNPTIKDGEYVIFMESIDIKENDIVIISNEWSECVIKRYRKKEDKVYFTSDNSEYPTVEPNEHYRIIGKVIEIVTRRKRF